MLNIYKSNSPTNCIKGKVYGIINFMSIHQKNSWQTRSKKGLYSIRSVVQTLIVSIILNCGGNIRSIVFRITNKYIYYHYFYLPGAKDLVCEVGQERNQKVD